MIRRSPTEYYLKWLIVHPDQYTDLQIEQQLQQQQLDSLGQEYLQWLRGRLRPPKPFYPADPEHRASRDFLIKEQILRMFRQDPQMQRALDILENSRAKEFVESMALVDTPDELIARSLTRHRRFPCQVEAVQLYRHFFWNLQLVDSTEVRALLQMRTPKPMEGQVFKDPLERERAMALYRASFSDPRTTAAASPNSPFTAMISQMQMGLMPQRVDVAKVLAQVQEILALKILESTAQTGLKGAKQTLDYTLSLRHVSEVAKAMERPDDKLLEQLDAIAIRTDSQQIPYLQELSLGQHTADTGPDLKEPTIYEPSDPAGPEPPAG